MLAAATWISAAASVVGTVLSGVAVYSIWQLRAVHAETRQARKEATEARRDIEEGDGR